MTDRSGRWLGAALALGGIAALVFLERSRPLRASVEPAPRRIARNLIVGAITAATVSAVERPIVTRVARWTEKHDGGVVSALPEPLKTAASVALMDYTLYWWHVLLHRVPFLWRLHEPHHVDRDLDTSTGVRFHFTEFLASVPWRCAQIALIGVSPRALRLWQTLTLAEVLFHHSNVRLPARLHAALSRILVTPRLHGLHHSVIRDERDSNFSSGLTLWDRLHATYRDDAREEVRIGLPGFERESEVTLGKTLALPFEPRR